MSDEPPVLADAAHSCSRCLKPTALCVCEGVTPIDNKVALLVSTASTEQDRLLGTARLATLVSDQFGIQDRTVMAKSRQGARPDCQSGRVGDPASRLGEKQRSAESTANSSSLTGVAVLIPDQDRALVGVKGIVIFDGTWSQAKTLWWRNAWVLKAKRLVLNPRQSSLYGKLRREPRREGLSTIEAAALTLSRIEQRPEIETAMRASFARMLARYRSARSQGGVGDLGAYSTEKTGSLEVRCREAPQEALGNASPSISGFYPGDVIRHVRGVSRSRMETSGASMSASRHLVYVK